MQSLPHIALDLLCQREHSRLELRHKLRKRGFAIEAIDGLLDTLEQQNVLSDARFAEAYVHKRSQQGYGPERIKCELNRRGVCVGLIDRTLTALAWQDLAQRVWQKKFSQHKDADLATCLKQMRFLHYRGFSREQIESVVNTASRQAHIPLKHAQGWGKRLPSK